MDRFVSQANLVTEIPCRFFGNVKNKINTFVKALFLAFT